MSRLDTFINRLNAQRACLAFACRLIETIPGSVLELGLGNGRTYDHLRELLPGREILVFERSPMPHPACMPDPQHLILGDLRATLATVQGRLGAGAALAHSDIGTGDVERNARIAAWLARSLPPLLVAGGIVASDQPLDDPRLEPVPSPQEVPDQRYFLYRHLASMASPR